MRGNKQQDVPLAVRRISRLHDEPKEFNFIYDLSQNRKGILSQSVRAFNLILILIRIIALPWLIHKKTHLTHFKGQYITAFISIFLLYLLGRNVN